MYWDITGAKLAAYILVFCRTGGMFFFNPVFSRKNIPSQVRLVLALGLTVVLTPVVSVALTANYTDLGLLLMMAQELFVGVACGIVFQFFFYMLFFAGDVIDTGFGLSMAKVFDPGTSVQASMSGNLFQVLFLFYFFATNSHLLFIRLIVASYDVVGIGGATLAVDVPRFVATAFVTAFSLMVQLILPFLASSFILEIAMGILMKLIPQINVFVVHFQLKILLGLGLMFLFAVPVAEFMNHYIDSMFVTIQHLLGAFQT